MSLEKYIYKLSYSVKWMTFNLNLFITHHSNDEAFIQAYYVQQCSKTNSSCFPAFVIIKYRVQCFFHTSLCIWVSQSVSQRWVVNPRCSLLSILTRKKTFFCLFFWSRKCKQVCLIWLIMSAVWSRDTAHSSAKYTNSSCFAAKYLWQYLNWFLQSLHWTGVEPSRCLYLVREFGANLNKIFILSTAPT